MNHIHQIIWNKTLGAWIVASELAKRGKKRGSIRRNALILPLLLYASAGLALPTGNELVAGSVNVTTPSAEQMQINQSSQKAIVNWQGFSIAGNESVNIQQPNANAALLNRVVGQDASSIQGKLNANGQVYLINPNGVIFSKTARVDVGGLIAGTHAISNQDFLDGKLHFTKNNAQGSVINHGQIKTPEGGVVALIGEQVENTGSIITPKGTTALAAGNTIDLDIHGDGLVEVKISEAAINAQINNHGIIQADGGQVIMTAKAAGQLLKTVINNDGIVEAHGLVEKNGKIVLSGGDNGVVQVSGTLDVSGQADSSNVAHSESSTTQGGNITVSGKQININDGAILNASGDAGGGTIIIGDKQSTSQTTLHSGSSIAAQAQDHGNAGKIDVLANMNNGTVKVEGQLNASAPRNGDGGFIETSAAHVKVADTAKINTTAVKGKTGTWLIDPTDYTIAASGGDTTGIALSNALNNTGIIILSTLGATDGNGDINVNDVVNWSANTLGLYAERNININANLNGSGTAQLDLKYGQASSGGGINDNYFINNGAKVTLPEGANFSTQKGSNVDNLKNYTVITRLGAEDSFSGEDLQGMREDTSVNYALGADIDATTTNSWNSGAGFEPVGNGNDQFTGNFAGLGHTITGLTINRPDEINVGLFGWISPSLSPIDPTDITISNLGLVNGNIIGGGNTNENYAGLLVGSIGISRVGAGSTTINNVYATGSVTNTGTGTSYVGGLAGYNNGTISNAYSTASVTDTGTGTSYVGGLVGQNFGGAISTINISNAYTTGSVTGTTGSNVGGLVGDNSGSLSNTYATGVVVGTGDFVGGLVGFNTGGISNAYASGAVSGNSRVGGLVGINTISNVSGPGGIINNVYATGNVTGVVQNVGGLVGSNESAISNAYATGSVTGDHYVGGLVGVNEDFGSISNAYASGSVSSTNGFAGGLVGLNSGAISNAFWDVQSTGQSNGECCGNSTGITGKTSAEMMQLATFNSAGWEISGTGGSNAVWRIYEGTTAPLLRSFLTPLTVTADNISKTYDGVIVNALSNPNYSIPDAAISGHLFNTANPYNGAINVSTTPYPPTGLFSDQQGYDISIVDAVLTINPATLTYTAETGSRVYGVANPPFTGTVTGFVNGESQGTVTTGTASFTSPANILSNVGSYAITGSGLTATNSNYVFAQAASNATALSITPATLTYTANASSRLYGAANPTFTGTVTGFVNEDTIASATAGAASFTSVANNLSNAGNYAIDGSGLIANNGNYTFTQAAGNATALSITPATLAYTANPGTRLYGAVNPAFTGTVTGFVNEDTIASATTGAASFTSVANNLSNAGNYAIDGSGLTANNGNYTFTQAAGNATALSITPALLVIAANADRKIYDGIAYTGGNGVTYAGLVNNETSSVLTGSLSYSGNSQGAINPGAYDITPGGLNSINYAITYLNGRLTIAETFNNAILDNIVPSVTSVTYKQPPSYTAYDFSSISVLSDLSVKDSTENFAGNTTQYCDDSTSTKQKINCQKRMKKENAILPVLKIKNSAGRVKRLQMSANKQFLSLLLEDGSVRIWDFQRGDQHQIVTQNKNQSLTDISSVDNKGEILSIASKAGIGTQEVIIPALDDKLAIDEPDVNHFITSNDGSLLLVSAGADQLSLWDSKYNKRLWQLPYERGVVSGLALTDNKHYGAVLSRQPGSYLLPADLQLKRLTDAVDIVDLGTGKIIKSLPNVGEQIVSMQFKNNDTLQLRLDSGELLDWPMTSDGPKRVANFAETIVAVDTAKEAYAYVLKDGTVRVRNEAGRVLLSIKNEKNPFQQAKLLQGDKQLLTVMANGELSLWDVASGKKLLRLFSTQQGWTVMDAFGRFDGSEEAMDNFSWSANEEDIPLDSFSENYYEPGLLSNVLQNQDFLNSNPDMVQNGITLPPKVALQIAGQQAKGGSVALQLDVYDRGGGIDKIHIYQNGKILSNESVVTAQQTQLENEAEHRVLTLNITPRAGKNTLKVIASNDMGIENSSTELSFDGKTKAYTSSLKLLTIGIDEYSDDRLNLEYSVTDANAIGEAIKTSSKIAVSKNLTNENATKPRILAELKELSQGVQQDVLVIYFAGHGLALGKEWYFLPYETTMQPTLEKIAATGITATELSNIFKNSKIQHILLMVDSCYSGAGMDAFSKLENGQRYFTRKLSRSLGITVMTAAAKDQKAYELKSLGHGLFTYLITQELQVKDATEPLTAHGIAENIAKTLPVFSKKMLGSSQEPAVYAKGNDFMLTDVLKEPNKGSTSGSNTPAIVPKKPAQ